MEIAVLMESVPDRLVGNRMASLQEAEVHAALLDPDTARGYADTTLCEKSTDGMDQDDSAAADGHWYPARWADRVCPECDGKVLES